MSKLTRSPILLHFSSYINPTIIYDVYALFYADNYTYYYYYYYYYKLKIKNRIPNFRSFLHIPHSFSPMKFPCHGSSKIGIEEAGMADREGCFLHPHLRWMYVQRARQTMRDVFVRSHECHRGPSLASHKRSPPPLLPRGARVCAAFIETFL